MARQLDDAQYYGAVTARNKPRSGSSGAGICADE
jgi:hypothetical protein